MRQMLFMVPVIAALLIVVPVLSSGHATIGDRHADYYYPQPQTTETYVARAQTLEDSDRARRIGFVTGVTQGLLARPYPPQYAIFAKGDEAEKLIIISLDDDAFGTLYRLRALLATLTAVARASPVFRDLAVEDYFTFLDLLKMLGFEQVTISDGRNFAHQIRIR